MSDTASSGFSPVDSAHMSLALQLAERGKYTAHPNPRVGCVIAHGDHVVGRGWHARAGKPHAEINALEDAGSNAENATAFVSLEPCSHHGKTPPCVDALVAAGIREVVCATLDPNPQVAGRGIAALEATGIEVRCGLMEERARKLNRGFFLRMTAGRPFVRLKMAASLDGATAMQDGESQWITGKEARMDVQRLRAECGAIMTGIGTVLADDPSLTVRDSSLTSVQPLRAVVDSQLRMPGSACMLGLDGETLIFCVEDSRRANLEAMGATVYKCAGENGRVDLQQVLATLATLEVNDVLVETGPILAGEMLGQNLVDELVIYQAPHIMGSETRGMFNTPGWTKLMNRSELTVTDVRQIGNDTRITATP